jgi:type II restriction enzyme
VVPPFNTAIVKGYNAVTGAKVKLGTWDEYLAMRRGMVELNAKYRDLLSNDLGAIAGVLFDLGSGRYPAPPSDPSDLAHWEKDLAAVCAEAERANRAIQAANEQDRTHAEIQGWLRDLGIALGFNVWIAANDRNRPYGSGHLADGCLESLTEPLERSPAADTIRLIATSRSTATPFPASARAPRDRKRRDRVVRGEADGARMGKMLARRPMAEG